MPKKIGIFLVGLLWAFCSINTGTSDDDYRSFHFRISGVYETVQIGDFNTFLKDTEFYYDRLLAPYGFIKDKNLEVIDHVWGINAEFIMRFTKHFGLGIKTGYIQQGLQTTVTWRSAELGVFTLNAEPQIYFVPLILKGYGYLPLNSRMSVYVMGGPGFYLVSSSYDFKEDSQITGNEGVHNIYLYSEGMGYGLEGGVGLEIILSSSTSFFIEGGGRHVNVERLTGRMRLDGRVGGSSGDVWYFEYFDENITEYISGIKYGEKPEPDGLGNIRRMGIDLSGYYLAAGFRFRIGIW